jgi:hypothetical protein
MILIASFGLVVPAVPQMNRGTIPAGTVIRVRTNDTIDANNAAPGRMFTGVVAENATDRHGKVVIPKGSLAELAVRGVVVELTNTTNSFSPRIVQLGLHYKF